MILQRPSTWIDFLAVRANLEKDASDVVHHLIWIQMYGLIMRLNIQQHSQPRLQERLLLITSLPHRQTKIIDYLFDQGSYLAVELTDQVEKFLRKGHVSYEVGVCGHYQRPKVLKFEIPQLHFT